MKNRLPKVIEFARLAHINDICWDGKQYFPGHVQHVIDIAGDKAIKLSSVFGITNQDVESIRIVAALHDVVEDHPEDFSFDELEEKLNLSKAEITALKAVTKFKEESYLNYTFRIVISNIYAKIVKLSDLQHNMSDLKEGSLKDKYRFAEYLIQKSLYPEP